MNQQSKISTVSEVVALGKDFENEGDNKSALRAYKKGIYNYKFH